MHDAYCFPEPPSSHKPLVEWHGPLRAPTRRKHLPFVIMRILPLSLEPPDAGTPRESEAVMTSPMSLLSTRIVPSARLVTQRHRGNVAARWVQMAMY